MKQEVFIIEAKRLIKAHYIAIGEESMDSNKMMIYSAKQCALISVKEIIKITPSVYLTDDNEIHSGHCQYWKEIKKEIENQDISQIEIEFEQEKNLKP